MTRALLAVLTFGVAIALGCANQAHEQTPAGVPAPHLAPGPTAPTVAPPGTASNAVPTPAASTAAASPSPDVLRRAREGGFKPEVHDGVTRYCVKDDKADTGTHFVAPKRCYDESQMLAILDQRQQVRDVLRIPSQMNPNSK